MHGVIRLSWVHFKFLGFIIEVLGDVFSQTVWNVALKRFDTICLCLRSYHVLPSRRDYTTIDQRNYTSLTKTKPLPPPSTSSYQPRVGLPFTTGQVLAVLCGDKGWRLLKSSVSLGFTFSTPLGYFLLALLTIYITYTSCCIIELGYFLLLTDHNLIYLSSD